MQRDEAERLRVELVGVVGGRSAGPIAVDRVAALEVDRDGEADDGLVGDAVVEVERALKRVRDQRVGAVARVGSSRIRLWP